jgi:hypothetical protein
MKKESSERILFGLFLAAWLLSFFLPAAHLQQIDLSHYPAHPSSKQIDSILYGWELARESINALAFCPRNSGDCYFGLLRIANIPMLLAAFNFHRIREGKGQIYAALLTLSAILCLSSIIWRREIASELAVYGNARLGIGYADWVGSVLGMASLFLWVTISRVVTERRRRVVG